MAQEVMHGPCLQLSCADSCPDPNRTLALGCGLRENQETTGQPMLVLPLD
jgi:hypothetical protein